MHPKDLSAADFTYNLPVEKIAKYPLQERDASKLLVWDHHQLIEFHYKDLPELIPPRSLLVFNDSKVIPARILFTKSTGGVIEIFCLEPHGSDYVLAMASKGSSQWHCMIGGAAKWKHGPLEKTIIINGESILLKVKLLQKLSDSYLAEFSWEPSSFSFAEVIEASGEIPLPPYIKRDVEQEDKIRYQTIYAMEPGSVAAPTAGLHFTPAILDGLKNKNVGIDFLTLHVGAGTFKPVKAEKMGEHEMHAEWIDVKAATIKNILEHLSNEVIAVGTTSLRTIESLYWLGIKCINEPAIDPAALGLQQWEVYEPSFNELTSTASEALKALLMYLQRNKLERLICSTQIMIAPGYSFRVAKKLITNFHQPQSTLLLLIAAIAGNEWKRIYEYALNNNFRFLSYGDGCMLQIEKASRSLN